MNIAGQKRNFSNFIIVVLTLIMGGCLLSESEPLVAANEPPPPSPGNSAPTISGSPSNGVQIGGDYTFTPTASDPDGDTLTFSVENRPAWSTFDTSTGRLAGTPTLADVGVYTAVGISVTDGTASASLQSYSLEVTNAELGSMSISWSAPTVNTDGSPLTDLAGYRIYYGTTQGVYPNVINIDNSSVNTYLIENLLPDTYYLAGTAFNVSGIESDFTSVATRIVQ